MSNNPFPGLRHFEPTEKHLFFGRDGQSNELLKRLQESRFLALVGVSGSGKSSLVRAGLLPALDGGLMASVESDWRIAVFRPGNNPIGNMARAMITQAGFGGDGDLEEVEVAIAETSLRRGNLGLLEFVRQAKQKVREDGSPFLGENENVLLVVDQFEEIFRIIEQYDELVRVKQLSDGNPDAATATAPSRVEGHPRDDASAFVKLLLESTRKNDDDKYEENIYVIVTMRSDYLGETAQFWGMPERINEGQYLIPRLTRDERRQAIVGPVAVATGTISEPLVTQLLNDAGENPGQLPILQHALMRMWELAERSPRNGGLNLAHYTRIGKLSGALSQHANEAYDEVPEELQKLTEKVFKCLTEKGLANREVRRPMPLADICKVVDANEADVKTVIEIFRKPGRWFLMPPPPVELEADTLIDISHESLISGWDKLQEWVNEEAESARTYKRLADTAILKEGKKEEFYRGTALQVALKWHRDNAPNPTWARRYHPEYEKAIAFLDASVIDSDKKEQEEKARTAKELRRRRIYNIILAVLVVLTLTSAIFGLAAQNRALDQQKRLTAAEFQQRQSAETREREAIDLRKKAEDAQAAVLTANGRLEQSLKNEIDATGKAQDATRKAQDAETLALAQADKARRLQIVNQEQATTNGYFKTAFDEVAAKNFDAAVASLDKARKYFAGKQSKPDQVSTQINIADVYRIAAGATDDSSAELRYRNSAVDEYDTAIGLVGSSDDKLLAPTLMKAGSVWAESDSGDQARHSAEYHERAGEIYQKLDQTSAASMAWLAAGTTLLRLDDRESADKATVDFEKAVSVHGNDQERVASTSAAVGDAYAEVLKAKTDSEEEGDEPPNPETAATQERLRDRSHTVGSYFYKRAAEAYVGMADLEKSAEMYEKSGNLLSGRKSPGMLGSAALLFNNASEAYARAGQPTEQRTVLLSAGSVFLEKGDKTLADQFYQAVVGLAGGDNVKKAEALKEIGESYGNSNDIKDKQKGVAYYQEARSLYQAIDRKDDEIKTLIDAAGVVKDLDDATSQAQTAQLYEEAVNVYQNDLAKQAKTLNSIGDAYSLTDEIGPQRQAANYYLRSADVAHRAGDKRQEVTSRLDAGRAYLSINTLIALAQARKVFEGAVLVDQNDIAQQTATLSRIGLIYALVEKSPQRDVALAYYERAVHLAREHNDKSAEVSALLLQARGIERLDGQRAGDQVKQLYKQAIEVYNNDPAKQVQTIVRVVRQAFGVGFAMAQRDPERAATAEQYIERALAVATQQQDKKILAAAHLEIGGVYPPTGQGRQKAIAHYRSALDIYKAEGDSYGQAMALARIANATSSVEAGDRALALFSQVLPALKASGNQKDLAEAYYSMGLLYRRRKEYREALNVVNQALQIFQTLPGQEGRVLTVNNLIKTTERLVGRAP